ncbi:amidase signature enzyme [Aspergillus phoenicis ATCC 13157]|uniref:Amidase signature enzyme n=1 Tax=Aspergillus phoenicis ATCC 13157 TaxID=1353007 RepID=A0A370P7U2_ASPPH|nr:amidase signature enzyme [Aspergillus phoenicis ATCC 13157]
MARIDLSELTIARVHTAFHRGDYSAADLVQAYLRRIDQMNPRLNAILAINPNAVQEAQALDDAFRASRTLRPLHGVPVLVKDNISTSAMPTTYGSKVAASRPILPLDDAQVIKQLEGAGAIILGKTTLPDWATDFFSASTVSTWTQNPYDLARDPGGSSSGTAAGIAANLALVGVGTDTGGSIRLPSSFCSLVGMRPTVGLTSLDGVSPFVGCQDTVGPMCRTVTDAARLLDTLVLPTSPQSLAPSGGSYAAHLLPDCLPGPVCLGHLPQLGAEEAAVEALFTQVLTRLRGHASVTVRDLDIPSLSSTLAAASIMLSRGQHDLDDFLRTTVGTSLKTIYRNQAYPPTNFGIPGVATHASTLTDRSTASNARDALDRIITAHLGQAGVEVLVFLTTGRAAPRQEEITPEMGVTFPVHAMLASTLQWPAISVPIGFTATGLPVGLEILGRPLSDQRLLEVAFVIEQIVQGRRPPTVD